MTDDIEVDSRREGDRADRPEQEVKRNAGQFPPGYCPPPEVRRKRGVKNKITRDLKAGIIDAAIACGSDGKGKDCLVGYLKRLAVRHPRAFTSLLGKLIPHSVGVNIGVGIASVNVHPIPSGKFMTEAQVRESLGMVADAIAGQLPPPDRDQPITPGDDDIVTFPIRHRSSEQ